MLLKEKDELVRIAGGIREAVILRYPYGGGGEEVGKGADGSKTVAIDLLAERAALDLIEEGDMGWNVLSEECGWVDMGSEMTVIIDPIDGTYNAIHGIPFFSTSLALSKGGLDNIICGVVLDLCSGRVYHALEGGGAFLDDRHIGTRPYNRNASTFSAFLGRRSTCRNSNILTWPKRGRYFGSISLEMCLVAKGALDSFTLFERCPRLVDVAAAYLILKEAGGDIFTFDNKGELAPYRLSLESGLNLGLFAVGDVAMAGEIVKLSIGQNPNRKGGCS